MTGLRQEKRRGCIQQITNRCTDLLSEPSTAVYKTYWVALAPRHTNDRPRESLLPRSNQAAKGGLPLHVHLACTHGGTLAHHIDCQQSAHHLSIPLRHNCITLQPGALHKIRRMCGEPQKCLKCQIRNCVQVKYMVGLQRHIRPYTFKTIRADFLHQHIHPYTFKPIHEGFLQGEEANIEGEGGRWREREGEGERGEARIMIIVNVITILPYPYRPGMTTRSQYKVRSPFLFEPGL